MKQWSEWKQKLLADKKLLLLACVFLAGVLLFALSGVSGGEKRPAAAADEYTLRASVEKTLEQRAEKLLSTVEGVGQVKVLVTVASLQETRYAENTQQGGADTVSRREIVIVEKNGEKTGLSVTVLSPVVRGVAVSCEGGSSARVRQEITSLLCAAFDLGAGSVYVSKLAQS